MRHGPRPAGWVVDATTDAQLWRAHLDPDTRLTLVTEPSRDYGMRRWQEALVDKLAATAEGWHTLDTGATSLGGTRCLQVLGCEQGSQVMVRHLWGTIIERQRVTITLRVPLVRYDAVVDDVVAAIAAWRADEAGGGSVAAARRSNAVGE